MQPYVRLMADAFEERALTLYAGYTETVKLSCGEVLAELKDEMKLNFAEMMPQLKVDIVEAIRKCAFSGLGRVGVGESSEDGGCNERVCDGKRVLHGK